MISTGIRELKNNLSHYVRQIEAGKRIAVTAHGRVVAEVVPPATGTRAQRSGYGDATQSARRGTRRSATKAAKASTPTFRYIETSALLAAFLEQDAAARSALHGRRRRITSALTFATASRALVRARVAGRLTPVDERAGLRWLQGFRRRLDVVCGHRDGRLVRLAAHECRRQHVDRA